MTAHGSRRWVTRRMILFISSLYPKELQTLLRSKNSKFHSKN